MHYIELTMTTLYEITMGYRHLGIADLEKRLSLLTPEQEYVYVETGTYKPYTKATVTAAQKRDIGSNVCAVGVYYIYPKPKQPLDDAEGV